MKKLVALIVAIACLLSCFSAFAADVSKIEAHIPSGIDLTPFKGDQYSMVFDNYGYDAQIQTKTISLKFEPTKSYYSTFEYYLRFDIKVVASNSIVVAVPRIAESVSSFADYKVSDLYIVNNENRYSIDVNSDGVLVLGEEGFAILKEISTTTNDVYIMTEYLRGASCYTGVKLTSANKALIKQFCDDCEASGILQFISSEDDTSIITQFN